MNIFTELQKRGYIITQKSVITQANFNIHYEIPREDLIQELALVVDWLLHNHQIWIQNPFSHNDIKPFCWIINKTLRNISEEDENKNCWLSGIDNDNLNGYDTPQEATIAAIEYLIRASLL